MNKYPEKKRQSHVPQIHKPFHQITCAVRASRPDSFFVIHGFHLLLYGFSLPFPGVFPCFPWAFVLHLRCEVNLIQKSAFLGVCSRQGWFFVPVFWVRPKYIQHFCWSQYVIQHLCWVSLYAQKGVVLIVENRES